MTNTPKMIEDVTSAPRLALEFSTPILTQKLPQAQTLNPELKRILLDKEQAQLARYDASRHRSNVSGWRSKDDVLHWGEPAIKTLCDEVVKAVLSLMSSAPNPDTAKKVKGFNMMAFANINRHGSYNMMHCHSNQHWAAVYYVDGGTPDPQRPENGVLELLDPRATAAAALNLPGFDFGERILVKPLSGMLLVFPAWLQHSVHPYLGEDERISIAFNIRLDF